MIEIKIADSKEKILHCLPAIQSLRPHITAENIFEFMEPMMNENFHIIYVEENGMPVAFSGYRFITHFYSGHIIYIDDLGTIAEHRGKGYGSALLEYIFDLAKQHRLAAVHLDSGHQRFDAHRLYLNKGFQISSHHFVLKYY